MSRTTIASAVLLSSAFLIAGCNNTPADGVVATVNGHAIQKADVDKIYDAQLAGNAQQQVPSADQSESLRLNILHELITEEVIEQRAAKQNLTATDAEVDAKLAEMKAPYTEEQFQAKLKQSNLTLDQIRHDLRRSLTQNKLLSKEIDSKITVTDADVTNYFNVHKSEYNIIETRYHLAGIQVTSQAGQQGTNLQNSKSHTIEEAQQKIRALKARLDAGDDFAAVAMNFSESPQTAPNGGDMGYAYESQIKADPTIYPAIAGLKVGQATDVLPINDSTTHKPVGYAIYKLLEKNPPGQHDLSDPRVLQEIRQQLRDGRSQLLKNAYFEMLRDQAKVQNYFAEQVFKNAAK